MALKASIVLFAVFVGCLANPKPSSDLSQFFDHANPEARVVGGTVAAEGAHPHMVALTTGLMIRSFVCGGSVITTRTVLTAAHCIEAVFSFGMLSSTLRVTMGTNRWNQGGQAFGLWGNQTHNHYVASTIKNDIGMLYTAAPITFNTRVQPIRMSSEYVGGGLQAKVAGWGRIRTGGPISAQLLEITLPTLSGEECVRAVAQAAIDFQVRAPAIEPHIELCVFHSPDHGVCNGDSGSALVRDDGTQIGIVSWGFPCARGAPDMFVRISAFVNWINSMSVGQLN